MLRRIALVSSSYFPYVGGVEEHVRQVASSLSARGHDVVVWTVDRGEGLGLQTVDSVEVRYLPTPLPARSTGAAARFLRSVAPAGRAWLRAYREFRPEVVHVHCFGPNGTYATALSRATRTPLVISSHGETFADDRSVFDRSRLAQTSLAWALRRACAVTGCSQVVVSDLTRFGSTGGVVVPNGVALDAPVPARAVEDPPYVLAYGRVERVKGFDLLLEAFARADLPPGTRLVVGGTGRALPALRTQVRSLGMEGRVDLPGTLSRAQIAELLAGAATVVVPSRREAFGLVVLEAWHAGAPLVVTSRGGPASVVTDGVDGLVVDPEDVEALGNAIATVTNSADTATRLAEAGRQSVRRYGWPGVASAYESVYDRCLPTASR